MKNRFSRFLSLALAAMMLLAIAPVSALADEPVVLTMAAKNAPSAADYQDRDIVSEIEKRLGIHLDITSYSTDAWETQLSLMMSSDELPDILAELDMSRADVNKYGQEGFFLDLSQYLDYMPNFKARLESDPILDAYSRDEHGAIYGISKTRDSMCSRAVSMAYLNKNWLKNVGMEAPTTTEELYQVLKAFKEQDANGNGKTDDEIPLSITFDGGSGVRGEYVLRSAFGIYGYSSNYQPQLDENGKVYLAETTEGWKEYVKYMNRLYTEGLLDPDCFIMTNDEYVDKTASDRIGLFASWNTLNRVFGTDDLSIYFDYIFFTGVTSDLTEEVVYPLWNPVTATCVTAVSADTEHPEDVARMLDYFYTEDGMELATYGTPGKNCSVIEGYMGIKTYDYTGYWENSGYESANAYVSNALLFNNMCQFVQYSPAQRVVDEATDEQLDQMLAEDQSQVTTIDAYKEKARRAVKCCDDFPLLVYTADETAERASLLADIQTYIKTMKAQFIIGETDIDSNWDTFINTLNGMRLQRLLEIEQQAYDRYAKNL